MGQDNELHTPGRLLVAWNLGQFSHYELFFELAKGYMHAASMIFEEQLQAGGPYYFKLLPGMFCLSHGIECFLKGAILLGDTSASIQGLSSRSLGHKLGDLHQKYCQIYSSDQFRLPTRAEQLIQWTCTVTKGMSGVLERYLFDTEGRPLRETGKDTVPLDDTLDLIGELARTFERVELEITNSKGITTRTPLEQNVSCIQTPRS